MAYLTSEQAQQQRDEVRAVVSGAFTRLKDSAGRDKVSIEDSKHHAIINIRSIESVDISTIEKEQEPQAGQTYAPKDVKVAHPHVAISLDNGETLQFNPTAEQLSQFVASYEAAQQSIAGAEVSGPHAAQVARNGNGASNGRG